jgi:hypothetical protein
MITFCKRCCINWARLHESDTDGDETYEVCPECRTSEYLDDATDFIGYLKCPITGRITEAGTGKLYVRPVTEKPRVRIQLKPAVPVKTKHEIREEIEDKALDLYTKTGSSADYFQTLEQLNTQSDVNTETGAGL